MKSPVPLRRESVVERSRDLTFTEVADDHLAIDVEAGYAWALDGIGHRVWELLASPGTVASICESLRAEYDVDEETCLRDVLELLGTFVDEGLVTVGGD